MADTRHRLRHFSLLVAVGGIALLALLPRAGAQNTEYDVINGQLDLTKQTTYTTGGTAGTGAGGTAAGAPPSVASDVTFDSGVTYTTPTAFVIPTNVTFGSLNELSGTAITISNNGSVGASTLTLGGTGSGVSSVPGASAGDLIFDSGANLSITGGTGTTALGILLGQSGNFDVASPRTLTISSGISDGGNGYTLTKTGVGTLSLTGGNNITTAVTVNNGSVYSSNVTPLQNVPNLTINNNGVVYYNRGSVAIANGAATDTVTVNSGGILSSDYAVASGSADTGIGAITLNGGSIQTRSQATTNPLYYDRGTFGFGLFTGVTAGVSAVTAGGGTNPTSTISAVNTELRETGGTIFNVKAGSGAGGSLAGPGGVDLAFTGTIFTRFNTANTALIKQGNGVMSLTGLNAFTTPVQVNGGVLSINTISNGSSSTTGTAALQTTAVSGGTASNVITVTDPSNIAVGQTVTGTGIAANTYVTNVSGNMITLSATPTAAVTGNGLFGAQQVTTITGTSGTNTVTVGSTAGLIVGQTVTGTGIPALTANIGNVFITAIDTTTNTVTLSSPLSATATGNGTFGANSTTLSSLTGVSVGQALVGGGLNAGSTIIGISGNRVLVSQRLASSSGGTSSFGTANSLGLSTNAASNLIIDGGTLQYTGVAASTDRLFTVGSTSGTGTIDASGTGALNFTNTGAIAYGTTGQARTLTLTGTFGTGTTPNVLTPLIADNGAGAVSLVKNGAGAWMITGNNTYSGGTMVNTGILMTGPAGTLGSGNVTVAAGAALTLGNSATVASTGSLLFASTSTITLNNTGSDTVAGITDTTTGASAGPGTYTATQLNNLFGAGTPLNVFTGSGMLTVVPEPSTWAMLIIGLAATLVVLHARRRCA